MRRFMTVLLAVTVTSLPLQAEVLTIGDAFTLAKEGSRSYQLSVKQYQEYVSEENKVNPFIPSLSVTGSVNTGASFIPSASFSGFGYSVGANASLTLSPSVYNNGKVRTADNQTRLLSLFSEEETLYTNVSQAYLNVLLYREAVAVSTESLASARERFASVEESYEEGLTSELGYREAESALASALFEDEENRSSLSGAERSFRVLTGFDITSYELMDITAHPFLSLPDADDLFGNYKEESNAIQIARNNVTVAELALQTRRNTAYIPTLSFSAAYTHSGSNIGSYNTQYHNRFSDSLSVSAAVSLPLDGYIPGSSSYVGVKSAENSLENAQLSLDIAYDDLFSSIEELLSTLSLLESQIGLLEAQKNTLAYQAELTSRAYENGEVSLRTLQEVNDSLRESEYSLLSLKVSYINTENALAILLGFESGELERIFQVKES